MGVSSRPMFPLKQGIFSRSVHLRSQLFACVVVKLSSNCRQDVACHERVYVICAHRTLMMCCGTTFRSTQLPKILFQPAPKLRSCPCHDHIAVDGSNTM